MCKLQRHSIDSRVSHFCLSTFYFPNIEKACSKYCRCICRSERRKMVIASDKNFAMQIVIYEIKYKYYVKNIVKRYQNVETVSQITCHKNISVLVSNRSKIKEFKSNRYVSLNFRYIIFVQLFESLEKFRKIAHVFGSTSKLNSVHEVNRPRATCSVNVSIFRSNNYTG